MKKTIAVLLILALVLGAVGVLADPLPSIENTCSHCGDLTILTLNGSVTAACVYTCTKCNQDNIFWHSSGVTCPYCGFGSTPDPVDPDPVDPVDAGEEPASPAKCLSFVGMTGYTVTFTEKGWTPAENDLLTVEAKADGVTFVVTPAKTVSARTELVFANGEETFAMPLAVNANGTLVLMY